MRATLNSGSQKIVCCTEVTWEKRSRFESSHCIAIALWNLYVHSVIYVHCNPINVEIRLLPPRPLGTLFRYYLTSFPSRIETALKNVVDCYGDIDDLRIIGTFFRQKNREIYD